MACKRKLWSDDSMVAACNSVLKEGKGLREAARLYNVPIETLRRRVNGSVKFGCKPGPPTVLTEEEEDRLADYLIKMSEMGFGLLRDGVMGMAFNIVSKSQRPHPFKNGSAGRAWFDGFIRRHPHLTIRSPQPLSYSRAVCANEETIHDFFGKLGALYGRLNLVSKPMQIYNCDETGVTIVFKPGRVVAEMGCRNVYAVSAAERGKTHTILSCVSASGVSLPPMMVYPRKRQVPQSLREGAYPNTLFVSSESGWINSELFIEWFNFFIHNIPPVRPVLLLLDGHKSHASIELIELALSNNIHLLCLPAHTSHLLQPLDVGVFKSFKTNFNKACSKYMSQNPGRVVTVDVIASLVAEAYAASFTPMNIMKGFKKTGVWPINPGEVTDRQIAPSKALCVNYTPQHTPEPQNNQEQSSPLTPLFSPEIEALYQKRYEEKYDIEDPGYVAWLKINHPELNVSGSFSDSSSEKFSHLSSVKSKSSSCSSDILSELLVLPEAKIARKRKGGLNAKAICITESHVLEEMKTKEDEKKINEQLKAERKIERERKRLEREEMKKEKAQQRKEKQKGLKRRRKAGTKTQEEDDLEREMSSLMLDEESDGTDDGAICPKCGASSLESDDLWIACDGGCDRWFDFKCTKIRSKRRLPEHFICEDCS